jgi:hypothetical protein
MEILVLASIFAAAMLLAARHLHAFLRRPSCHCEEGGSCSSCPEAKHRPPPYN